MSSRKTRIAVVNTHPIQYFAPLYAYLNTSPDIEVTALYLSDFSLRGATDRGFGQVVKWDVDLLAGYPHSFIGPNAKTLVPGGFSSMIVPQIWGAVRGGGFDALWIHGHGVASQSDRSRGGEIDRNSGVHALRDASRLAPRGVEGRSA